MHENRRRGSERPEGDQMGDARGERPPGGQGRALAASRGTRYIVAGEWLGHARPRAIDARAGNCQMGRMMMG